VIDDSLLFDLLNSHQLRCEFIQLILEFIYLLLLVRFDCLLEVFLLGDCPLIWLRHVCLQFQELSLFFKPDELHVVCSELLGQLLDFLIQHIAVKSVHRVLPLVLHLLKGRPVPI